MQLKYGMPFSSSVHVSQLKESPDELVFKTGVNRYTHLLSSGKLPLSSPTNPAEDQVRSGILEGFQVLVLTTSMSEISGQGGGGGGQVIVVMVTLWVTGVQPLIVRVIL